MRRSIPLLIATLALAPLSLSLAPRVDAEDAADDQSPAAKAYRDAWWAETGGGNLTQALEGYTKASEAEGPPSLKARALYQKAVVLQRIGRTEEAIRTLERLAKEYPGEAAPQADARARLAEWTAVDLKTSFAEWYQRYQYSPEFQAKIIDLVLKLGSFDANTGTAAAQEILTIGAPAIPALRQHVESPNVALRDRVVTALLQLGEVPSMAALREMTGWRQGRACWATLKSASQPVRARLKAEAKADQAFDQGLLAAFDGPVALLTWVGTSAAEPWADLFLSYGFWWDEKDPDPQALRPLLLALAENKTLKQVARSQALRALHQAKLVDAARAEAWAAGDDPYLRTSSVAFLADPRGGPDSRGALRRTLKLASAWEMEDPKARLFVAVLAGLDAAPSGDDLDGLADDLLAIWNVNFVHDFGSHPSAAARVVLARMVDRAQDPLKAVRLLETWQRGVVAAGADQDRLADWVRSARSEDLRRAASGGLIAAAGGVPEQALALLAEPTLAPDARLLLFEQLVARGVATSLMGDPTSRRALLAVIRTQEQTDPPRAKLYATRLLELLSRSGIETRRATVLEWIADPSAFPRSLFLADGVQGYIQVAWAWERMGPAWRSAWPTWTPAQRDAAVEGLGALVYMQDPELKPFLRTIVRDPSNGISATSRRKVLELLDPLTLEDLRAAFDLTTPEGTDAAILLAWRVSAVSTPAPTPELFEALKLGLRPDGPDASARALRIAFMDDVRFQRVLIEALLAHRVEGIQAHALSLLAVRESSDDLPLWLKALALPSAGLRAQAASGLGRIAHPDATKALVAALDDPNSRVRDAVIASLEAIQKVEDLKRSWLEKAAGVR